MPDLTSGSDGVLLLVCSSGRAARLAVLSSVFPHAGAEHCIQQTGDKLASIGRHKNTRSSGSCEVSSVQTGFSSRRQRAEEVLRGVARGESGLCEGMVVTRASHARTGPGRKTCNAVHCSLEKATIMSYGCSFSPSVPRPSVALWRHGRRHL